MVYTPAASLSFVLVSQFVGGSITDDLKRAGSLPKPFPGGGRVAKRHSRSFIHQGEERETERV